MRLRRWLQSIFKPEGLPDNKIEESPVSKADVWSRVEEWPDNEISSFVGQLLQTISWTENLAAKFDATAGSYATVFRQTNPLIQGKYLYDFESEDLDWNLDPYSDHKDIYRELLPLIIQNRPAPSAGILQDLSTKGRILSFETNISTRDGAPVCESKGFVDLNDVPPIDTWFYLKDNYNHSADRVCSQALFCWIPKAYEGIMQSAIDVEIFDSYRWLDENDKILYHRISSKLQQG